MNLAKLEAVVERQLGRQMLAAQTDQIGKFWVVTYPTGQSEMGDICFEANVQDLMLMSRGGLNPNEIQGIFKSQGPATALAKQLLSKQGN